MIMGVAAVGHGGPTPKPRCVPAHSPFPQLFTATVAQIGTNHTEKWRVSVKAFSPGVWPLRVKIRWGAGGAAAGLLPRGGWGWLRGWRGGRQDGAGCP